MRAALNFGFRSSINATSVVATAAASSSRVLSSKELMGGRLQPFRLYSTAQAAFEKAQEDMKKLPEEPNSDVKLRMYGLYKQVNS